MVDIFEWAVIVDTDVSAAVAGVVILVVAEVAVVSQAAGMARVAEVVAFLDVVVVVIVMVIHDVANVVVDEIDASFFLTRQISVTPCRAAAANPAAVVMLASPVNWSNQLIWARMSYSLQ